MKKKLMLLLTTLFFAHSLTAEDSLYYFPYQAEESLSYENLSDVESISSSYALTPFLDCFKKYKVRAYLEFGTGLWTSYFLESCNKVISVDFVTPGYGPDTIKNYLGLFSQFSNWTPIVFFSAYQGDSQWAPYKYLGSEHIHKAASYQCATHQNYALLDDFYLVELNAFISTLVKYNKFQIAFVNSGLYLRGDLVQLMFGKIPIIFASDTNCRALGINDDVYGYSRVVTPEDYEEIFISCEQGYTIWIQKQDRYMELINDLKNLL